MSDCIDIEEKAMLDDISSTLENTGKERKNLIPLLQIIQEKYFFLSPEVINMLAEHLKLGRSEIYGVATFYNQFRFNPPGKHQIKVCMGTACHVKGGDIILENFERKLDIKAGNTTEDMEFSIDRVACIGCCALAPAAAVDDKTHAYMTPSKIEGIFLGYEIEREMEKRRSGVEKPEGVEGELEKEQ